MVAVVLARAVQQVCVEEQCVASFHFTMDQFESIDGRRHPLGIGADLFTGGSVIYATDLVGSSQHLEAAVRSDRPIDRDHAACHVWKEATEVVPITIVLMPFPSTADMRLFKHHFVVIVINLVAQQPRHHPRYSLGTNDSGIDGLVVQLVAQCQLALGAGSVPSHIRLGP